MVGAGLPVVLCAPSGKTLAELSALVPSLRQRGARPLVISDAAALLTEVADNLVLPTGIPEWLSPLPTVAAGQLWALFLALAKGLDPDRPRGLNKVTKTH